MTPMPIWRVACSCGRGGYKDDGTWVACDREHDARAKLAVLRAHGHNGAGHELTLSRHR